MSQWGTTRNEPAADACCLFRRLGSRASGTPCRGGDRERAGRRRPSRWPSSSARARSPGRSAAPTGKKGDVDEQKEIDLLANNRIVDVLSGAPVAAVASEEMDAPLLLDEKAPLLVAVDPLDGSSNIDANASIGMIFTVLPALEHNGDPSAFLQPGVNQLAGGFFVYGPQTVLVVTVGAGTQIFTLDRRSSHVPAHASEGRDPAARQRVRDQRLQLAPLGRSDPHLRRGLPARQGRAARPGLQHALDRLAGRRHLSHRLARRHLPLSRRQAPRASATGGCG